MPVVTGLAYPAMFTVAPDGRVLYSELSTGRMGVSSVPAHTSVSVGGATTSTLAPTTTTTTAASPGGSHQPDPHLPHRLDRGAGLGPGGRRPRVPSLTGDYYVVVRAVVGGAESASSNEVAAAAL